jgi:hypothetical protein
VVVDQKLPPFRRWNPADCSTDHASGPHSKFVETRWRSPSLGVVDYTVRKYEYGEPQHCELSTSLRTPSVTYIGLEIV